MSTPVLAIRAATPADLPIVTELVTALNREEGYDISASATSLQEVLYGNSPVRMRALVAEQGGQVVGLALYYSGYDTVSASHGYHLADIVVQDGMRQRGIGSQLFRALATQCLDEQGQWISLTVLKKNARAQQFYKRFGMVEVAVNFLAIGPQGLTRCAAPNA